MTKEQEAILKRAIAHYGIDNQLTKTIEELSELTKEICKLKIAGKDFNGADLIQARQNLLEEKADVYITLRYLDMMFGDSSEIIDKKIARLEAWMNKDDQNNCTRDTAKQ